ncbi:Astra associated protein 1 Asa1 [Botryosphaeria dothidea]
MARAPSTARALHLQQSERPPAHPAYVLRGHAAQVHAVRFVRHNSRLLTGDADGWVVLWDIATKRPAAVWRAHNAAILGFGTWDDDVLITQGRDFHVRVWQLRPAEEKDFSTVLPVKDTTTEPKQPWLLHSLQVNTLNFCSFAICSELPTSPSASGEATLPPILIAVPGVKDDEVDIFQLPSERRVSTIPNIGQKTALHCVSAYESGATAVHAYDATANIWSRIYTSQPHSQPILSLYLSPPTASSQDITYFTSGADDLIAKHIVPLSRPAPPQAIPPPTQQPPPTADAKPKSLLSAALAAQPSQSSSALPPPLPNPAPVAPAKETRTKHSGQQSLTVRSDGRILATAGWDGRVRVYGAKSLKEVAVLAWHKEGCYAVGFADVGVAEGGGLKEENGDAQAKEVENDGVETSALVKSGTERQVGRTTLRSRRENKSMAVHWIAAGSKDGKVSLWEVF